MGIKPITIRVAALALAFALAACGSTPTPPVGGGPAPTPVPAPTSNPLQGLANFTLADLKAASADAHAQPAQPGCTAGGDCTAYVCYDYLIQVIPTIQVPGGGQTVGAILLFQQGRDLLNGVSATSGLLTGINRACAPLVISAQTTINQLLLMGAGTAATGGALAPVLAPIGLAKPAKP